ncbi:cyclic-di-AMP-binding protein CbpB [Brochothrix campestris]|uniref:CBS domain-containing protein n=1 Tax=Brochothrix campestris FSL F6-1037 TaxID=1265861 RepID=W7CPV6_9LIST|nr:cyclic-di-AMP-binding protein CbpB [Brochothrix campestris]EUJ39097.1 hypothetical protein BCAMP_08090 [Brochothrix campestris FSL F6-1037]
MNHLLKEEFEVNMSDYLIPASKVAHVFEENSLEHTLLVLTTTGYTLIPVLDYDNKYIGMINNASIINHVMGIERILFEQLPEVKVADVVIRDYPVLREGFTFDVLLKQLIDHSFLCVVNDQNEFMGIVTRRVALKRLAKAIHQPVTQ